VVAVAVVMAMGSTIMMVVAAEAPVDIVTLFQENLPAVVQLQVKVL